MYKGRRIGIELASRAPRRNGFHPRNNSGRAGLGGQGGGRAAGAGRLGMNGYQRGERGEGRGMHSLYMSLPSSSKRRDGWMGWGGRGRLMRQR